MVATGATHSGESDFTFSLEKYETYPCNLVLTREFPHSLDYYRERLVQRAKPASSERNPSPVHFWDLTTTNDGTFHWQKVLSARSSSGTKSTIATGQLEYQHRLIVGLADLKTHFYSRKQCPHHRFIHIRSTSSHGSIAYTLEEITWILTAHQVMPSFVNHLLTDPGLQGFHGLTSFKVEDHLEVLAERPGLQSLKQPDVRIQHCFNILGIQKNPDGQWESRQIAVYHSFDAVKARAVWVVKKGDSSIRRRLERATRYALSQRPGVALSFHQSFTQTLRDHLLIVQWCTEGWEEHLESLEESYRRFTIMARYPRVQQLAEDDAKWREKDRRTQYSSRNTVDRPENDESETGTVATARRVFWGMARFVLRSPVQGVSQNSRHQDAIKSKNLKLGGKLFTNLQSLGACAAHLENMISRLDQSTRVIEDLRVRYHSLLRSRKFQRHIPEKEIETCLDCGDEFEAELRLILGTLESFRAKAKTVLGNIAHSSNIFNYLFQERSMYSTEYFAASSRDSADAMEKMTEDMHGRATSMHVVTMVTLVFLPGTFVATVFSSGILTFGEDGGSGFGRNMGDWKVRLAGLKLFFAVCIPLLCATFFVWFAAYRFARTNGQHDDKVLDEEGPRHDDGVVIEPAPVRRRVMALGAVARSAFARGQRVVEGIRLEDLQTPGGVSLPSRV